MANGAVKNFSLLATAQAYETGSYSSGYIAREISVFCVVVVVVVVVIVIDDDVLLFKAILQHLYKLFHTKRGLLFSLRNEKN